MDRITFRNWVRHFDAEAIKNIVLSTGFFSDAEVKIAYGFATERLIKGLESDYHFLFAEIEGQVIGYIFYAPVHCSEISWEIYWIVIQKDYQHQGFGKELIRRAEKAIEGFNGKRIYIETSSRELYKPTRAFYRSCGYEVDVVQNNFYNIGDSRIFYLKDLTSCQKKF
jgi:GNAT superfamily N-acetyltransferase